MFDSCGTPAYVAPEVLMKKGYSKEVDVWSTGIILYTMIMRGLPFHDNDRKVTFKQIKEKDPDMTGPNWEGISEECKDLVNQMLNKDPKKRISVDDALIHKAFINYGGAKELSNKLRERYITVQSEASEIYEEKKPFKLET